MASYQGLQLQGRKLTEQEIKAIEREIIGLYKQASKEADSILSKFYAKTSGMTTAERYDYFIAFNRNEALEKEIISVFKKYDAQVRKLQLNAGRVAMSNNYYRQLYASQWLEPVGFQALNQKLVTYAVTGNVKEWRSLANKPGVTKNWVSAKGTLSRLIQDNQADTLRRIRTSINTGVLNGESYAKLSKKVRTVIGRVYQKKEGGKLVTKISGAAAKAARIVRTEGNRLLNAGALAHSYDLEKQGFETEKMWDATLDSATRPPHGEADGQIVSVKEPFIVDGEELMFPGDPAGSEGNVINCRCTYVNLLEGHRPQLTRGRNPVTGENEVMNYQKYNEWAESNGLVQNKYGQWIKKD